MAVAVVDTGTATYNASATTQNYTFTVSATATLAVFFIAQDATQTVSSVTWDQGGTNQSCTLVGSEPCPTAANGKIYIYAVVNPTAGASKTLRVVNAVAAGTSAQLQSYSGTVTSSVAAACTNVLVANGTSVSTGSSVGTAAQSGASGDMYISGYVTPGGFSAVNNTQIYLLAPAGDDAAGNRAASTGTSITLSATISTLSNWAAVSCDIVASTAVSNPTFNIDTSTPKRVTGAPQTALGLNPNIFTNPFPIRVTDRLPAVWVPKTLPWPPQPLNINLFTNPFPFNQYDYSKPYFPIIRPYPQDGININLFTNPFPYNQYDWNKPFFPHFLPYPQDGININLFTNPVPILSFDFGRPYIPPNNPLPPIPLNLNLFTVVAVALPFNQYDWSTTRWFAKPVPLDIQFNPNLFTNPYPFNQYDWSKPYFPVVRPYPQDGININIFTNPVPFNQVDWSKPFFPHFLPDPQVGINANIFTNPIPVLNIDQHSFALRGTPQPDQAYNQNLYVVVVTATPFNQTDWAVPIRQRPLAPTDQQFNPNLFTNPIPFNQTDFSPAHRLPQAPFDLSFALNLNIFTNPIPIFNFDYTPQRKPLPVPLDPNQGFNVLYQPIVTVTLLQRTLTGVGL